MIKERNGGQASDMDKEIFKMRRGIVTGLFEISRLSQDLANRMVGGEPLTGRELEELADAIKLINQGLEMGRKIIAKEVGKDQGLEDEEGRAKIEEYCRDLTLENS